MEKKRKRYTRSAARRNELVFRRKDSFFIVDDERTLLNAPLLVLLQILRDRQTHPRTICTHDNDWSGTRKSYRLEKRPALDRTH